MFLKANVFISIAIMYHALEYWGTFVLLLNNYYYYAIFVPQLIITNQK